MPTIHPTAIIDAKAQLADDVVVEAYVTIGGDVKIGAGTRIQHHVVLQGNTTIGARNNIFPFAVLGTPPQDLKYRGGPTTLEIGDDNVIREFVLMKTGTEHGGGRTTVGNRNLFMANAHVAHDCRIGSFCVLANFAALAGHIEIEDYAIIGGITGFHQFVRIGQGAMVGGGSMVPKDVPPFCVVSGNRARLFGLNHVGLVRRKVPEDEIGRLKRTYRTFFRSGKTLAQAREEVVQEHAGSPYVAKFVQFVDASTRGVLR